MLRLYQQKKRAVATQSSLKFNFKFKLKFKFKPQAHQAVIARVCGAYATHTHTLMASLIKWDSPQVTKKGALVAKRASGNQQIEELLDAIVPPKSYATDDGSLWQQRISATPATKMDVTRLHESLDQQLLQRQARETGVCPVREGLYREAYGACGSLPPYRL